MIKANSSKQLLHKDNLLIFVFIVFSTFLTLIVNSYRYGVSDQRVYIPLIDKILQPELFPNDLLFEQPQEKYSLLLPVIAGFVRVFGLQWAFFVGYFLTVLVIFLVVYHLAYAITGTKGAACLAVLVLVISQNIAGTQTATIEKYFVLRTISLPFALGCVYFFIEKKYIRASISAGLAFLIHPITAVAPITILFSYITFNIISIGWAKVIKIFGAFILIASPLLLTVIFFKSGSGGGSLLSSMSSDWLNILQVRHPYIFPSKWHELPKRVFTWMGFIKFIVLFVLAVMVKYALIYKTKQDSIKFDEKDRRILYSFLISLSFLGISYLFGDVYPLPLIIQFQVARGLYLVYFISVIYAIGVFWTIYQKLPLPKWFIHAVIITVLIATNSEYLLPPGSLLKRIDFPGLIPAEPWMELQYWVEKNTPTNALFLVPPQEAGFRVYAKRGIVGDLKDGGPGLYSEEYAKKWQARMNDLKDYDSFNEAKFSELADKYGASYIVTQKDHSLKLEKIYENNQWALYKI